MTSFIISALLLGIALSMDSFAVSITCGLQRSMCRRRGLVMALSFALFQGVLPVLGALLGNIAREYVSMIDHWLAFGLLAIIGIKMFLEGWKYNLKQNVYDFTKPTVLFTLAFATSIDAFVVGIGFGIEWDFNRILLAGLIIGLSTFIFSLLGVFMGMKAFFFKPKLALMFGGAILFALGLKILLEHTIYNNSLV